MRIEIETRIAAPPSDVFAFHDSPGALARMIPPWGGIELVLGDGPVPLGARTRFRIAMGRVTLPWELERVEYEPVNRFADRQVRGPFAQWYHSHIFFEDDPDNTIMRDEVDFELPFGALGRAWLGRSVWRRLWKLFEYRHEVTKRLVEAGDFPGSPRAADVRARSVERDIRLEAPGRRMQRLSRPGSDYSRPVWTP